MSGQRSSYMIEKVGIDYPNRRSHRRGPGMMSALSVCRDDGRSVDCVLLDISTAGAKVKLVISPDDGEDFNPRLRQRLYIPTAGDLPVEVMWQDGSIVGFRFLSGPHEVAGALKELLPLDCAQFDDVERDAN